MPDDGTQALLAITREWQNEQNALSQTIANALAMRDDLKFVLDLSRRNLAMWKRAAKPTAPITRTPRPPTTTTREVTTAPTAPLPRLKPRSSYFALA